MLVYASIDTHPLSSSNISSHMTEMTDDICNIFRDVWYISGGFFSAGYYSAPEKVWGQFGE